MAANANMPVTGGEEEKGGWTIGNAYVVFLLTMAYAFNFFDRLLISTLLPLIKADLELSDTELGLVTGLAFVLIYATMGIPVARLADKYSRKVILGVGFTFWSAMTFLTGYVNSFWQLAATRFLMGAGESAGTPPSTSMLSDLMNDKARPLAFSIMVSGTSISSLFLLPAAGWIGQEYGWRIAYFLAGGAGLFFGLLILLTVKEPKRGQFEKKSSVKDDAKPAFGISMSFLLKRKTFVYATLGAALVTISYYAHIVWSAAFMLRVHDLNVAESATLLGPVRGIAGLTGAIVGSFLITRLRKSDDRWSVWLPAICATLVGLMQFLFLFGSTIPVVTIGAGLDSFFMTMMVPLMSLLFIQVMPPSIRTLGMALYVLAIALVGQIVGPLGVGALNDYLNAELGDLAIRYSMAATAVIGVIAGPIMVLAAKTLTRDVKTKEDWTGV